MLTVEPDGIAFFLKNGILNWDRYICQFRVQNALYGVLQPACHGDIVRPDAPLTFYQLALQKQNMARPCRREDISPEAGDCRFWPAIGF